MVREQKKQEIVTDPARIEALLTRGVAEVIDRAQLEKVLAKGKELRVKLGIDPTSPHLHVGRAVVLHKLRDFQELGHKVVLIVGDATGVIGDTSDKESERPMLIKEEVTKNAESYFSEAGKILDMERVETHHNSEWLNDLSYEEIGEHANQFSVADFIARDNIKRRLDAGKRVSLREVLYPLMQGYDSVMVKADVELGGVDQRFNLLAGRVLQEYSGQAPQNIVMTKLIEGLDGRKMSSSWNNVIALTDTPEDMYGKVMRLNDDLLEKYFITLTRVPHSEVEALKEGHPKDMKMRLAKEIVALYHGDEDAQTAEGHFTTVFQERGAPETMDTAHTTPGTLLSDVLVGEGVVASKTEFRRLLEAGAIVNLDTKETVQSSDTRVEGAMKVKVGKRRFIEITI